MDTTVKVTQSTIFFDGICNLCNATVRFIIKRDPSARFKFASLQSEYAQRVLPDSFTDLTQLGTFVLVQDGEIFTKSTAALKVTRYLTGGWPFLYLFIIVPRVIRNKVYGWVARNRYRWFGKTDECMLPTPEFKTRFVD